MARSKLTDPALDAMSDSGSVLWSLIQGEQLEFTVSLDFLTDVSSGYTFEAVAVEALNVDGQTSKPTTILPGGVQTTLNVRKPNLIGVWNAGSSYNAEDIVSYEGSYYKLLTGNTRVSATLPTVDPLWTLWALNKIQVQLPSTLGTTYAVQPTVGFPIYAFFELRVTEPNNTILVRTWKPARGMIELLFSPTQLVT
jgi:hypothetical protein